MTSKDLMLGDLVYARRYHTEHEPEIVKVVCCDITDRIWAERECGLGQEFDRIKPIPLTPEILEKNGWKYEFDKEEYRVKYMLGEQGKNCWIMWSCKYHIIDIQRQDADLDIYNLCITKVCVPCEYVHQLQHALRLCGIKKEIEL